MNIVYHITESATWDLAKQIGYYLPSAYKADGFIHCSFEYQVLRSAGSFYRGKQGLVLLKIDASSPGIPLRVENLYGGEEKFPHIYGNLPLNAVVSVMPFNTNAFGEFEFPVFS